MWWSIPRRTELCSAFPFHTAASGAVLSNAVHFHFAAAASGAVLSNAVHFHFAAAVPDQGAGIHSTF